MKKIKVVTLYAFATAGAYLFFFFGGFCASLAGAEQAHPREKLASYTTYFNQNDGGRCENIRLAAEKLNGLAVQPYGELSFNGAVGPRTEKNGYKKAKVIVQGEFVEGIGGGVCQVSTTLYNAALLSGLGVIEYHPHSMRVGYVPPSRDAMVTAWCDLRLYNPYSETVYISSTVGQGYLRITLCGKPDGNEYVLESRTIAEIPPEPSVEEGETDGEAGIGQPGLKSECFLKTYKKGVLLSMKRLRQDEYQPQRVGTRKKS